MSWLCASACDPESAGVRLMRAALRAPLETGALPLEATVDSLSGSPCEVAVTETRAGTIYKRPESVLVVVYSARSGFLLLRRTAPDDFWQSVTGSLRIGECPRQAALRELKEETGLWISPSALCDLHHCERFPIMLPWRARYAPGTHYNLEHWFAVRLSGRRLVRLNRAEHLEYRWLPAQRAAAMASSWSNRKAILALGWA